METFKIDGANQSKLMQDYLVGNARITKFFADDFSQAANYKKRLEHIKTRTYQRGQLTSYLASFNERYHPDKLVMDNIDILNDPESVVVVGGQQAGLLTGPVYTIHKCLSVIKLAEQKQRALGVPVIPVFWIAGEDHDFPEVNHINAFLNGSMKKLAYHPHLNKQSVSKMTLDQEKATRWLSDVLAAYGETENTQDLQSGLEAALRESVTLVDFFAILLHQLFGKYGLVLMDSGDSDLRKLESDYFLSMIDHNKAINRSVLNQIKGLEKEGYQVELDQGQLSANLFIEVDGERELLERDEEGHFYGKNHPIKISKEELRNIAKLTPERLSNNVVTRPIMQELVLPTLAFIGGPGEIAYWSALNGAFAEMACMMPLVVPRLNVTIVDRQSQKWLKEKSLSVEAVVDHGLAKEKDFWLKAQNDWDIDTTVNQTMTALDKAHEPLRALAMEVDSALDDLSKKNLDNLRFQIEYLQKKIEQKVNKRHAIELGKFDHIEAVIKPNGQYQERTWNAYYFINLCGYDVIDRLFDVSYTFDGGHYIVLI